MTWITEEEARMMDEEMHSRYIRWKRQQEEARFKEVVHGPAEHLRKPKIEAEDLNPWPVVALWGAAITIFWLVLKFAENIDHWGGR